MIHCISNKSLGNAPFYAIIHQECDLQVIYGFQHILHGKYGVDKQHKSGIAASFRVSIMIVNIDTRSIGSEMEERTKHTRSNS
jgi:hypothetical protein